MIKAYTDAMRWVAERAQLAAHYPSLSEDVAPPGEWSAQTWAPTASKTLMEIAHEQSSGLHSVLACLDDDLGVLRDIIMSRNWSSTAMNSGKPITTCA